MPPSLRPPPSPGFPCHHSGCRRAGSGEPLGFQTGEEEGRGQAGPSPASIPRGPGQGDGGRRPYPFPVQLAVPSPSFLSRGPPGPGGAEEGPELRADGGAAHILGSCLEMGTLHVPAGAGTASS